MTSEFHSQATEQTAQAAGSPDTGLACLILVSRILGIPADENSLRQEFVIDKTAIDAGDICKAAKKLKLKARMVKPDIGKINHLTLPSNAVCQNDSYVVILRCDGTKFLLFDPVVGKPEVADQERFAEDEVSPPVK